jgi:acyl-CoA reductase-like NAD-dependent aldehyde dehydrogenase
MKPAIIEAAGNDAAIVSRHADLEVAAAALVTAGFLQSGQVCTSTERAYVQVEVHGAFVEALCSHAWALRIGHGLGRVEIGPRPPTTGSAPASSPAISMTPFGA